jgi:hypothetical protein
MGISSTLRNIIWCTYIGEEKRKGLCLCCNTEQITTFNHECGHIIAHINGGKSTLENLRPVCSSCNKSMGTQNMEDFIKSLGKTPHLSWKGLLEIKNDNNEEEKDNNNKELDNNNNDAKNKIEIKQMDNIDRLAKLKNNKKGPFVCEICNETFKKKVYLVSHIKRKIPCGFIKNFTCDYCNYTFSTNNSLKRHHERGCEMNPILLSTKLIERNKVIQEELKNNKKLLSEFKNKYPNIKLDNI